MEFDELSRSVIGCAIEVHRTLGPGLLESTYRQCLAYELSHAQIRFRMELPLPVRYKDVLPDCGYRIDLLVSGDLIVEVKAVECSCQSTRHKSSRTSGWPRFQLAC
jgi:GxxExxY protein